MNTTVAARLRDATERLGPGNSTARLDAELLMAAAFGVSRSELLLRHMRDPAPDGFEPLLARRLANEPVAYILGTAEFYGLELEVTPAVLIPRADSETAIEAARDAFAGSPPARILDCGTGSGALLLAALSLFPEAAGVGIDRSTDALAVAARNAAKLGLTERAAFHLRDWDQPGWAHGLGASFDLILANPPYVENDAALEPVVRDHEPAGALFAGPEGLDAYRILIPQLPALLAPQGLALVEIGYRQAGAVAEIGAWAGLTSRLHRDLAGRARVVAFSAETGHVA
ncbi:peptide chain release factor N(5)-glutamine methyltransferase [Novosphingobium mangrovi (ex Huang et al. 2023)]|uniref:Release factor glutamine methyltransferase n=1 Tax=Novosphingobium mangrovi (ex Huang et al. 2023) TaxID=2976432 RepID=A0ABT2I2T6_9SPHN|nr:peptide chain release factor N(5)-glutamine methyltransferase [Novosphingobium mangrovi (ex Huang et al. 2023)]MCT2399112.1 peptide chain release factor N(5)-glutamine methyltransferase [Novosphingobium mangrovi (ex Huang et al. 2023)]